jgi:hypothetical protein
MSMGITVILLSPIFIIFILGKSINERMGDQVAAIACRFGGDFDRDTDHYQDVRTSSQEPSTDFVGDIWQSTPRQGLSAKPYVLPQRPQGQSLQLDHQNTPIATWQPGHSRLQRHTQSLV